MAIDHVKIPQDIHVEDKIIGPLSLRQVGLVAAGGGVSYALFATLQKSVGYVPIVAHAFIWLPLLICGAYALVRINNLSLFRLTLLVIEQQVKPRQRPWVTRRGLSVLGLVPERKKKEEPKKDEKNKTKEKAVSIEDLAGVLDTEIDAKSDRRAQLSIAPGVSKSPSPSPVT